ncbi:hypothetical protein GGI02_001736 [Coemansia sp. RSA 2322]|nr:hypothetical protein GGI02_001736 [Coemansia sp. RSA 2322]
MSQYQIFTVDAFANEVFKGNQAAVVPVPSDKPIDVRTMQAIGAEMNISETAFITPTEHQGSDEFLQASRFELRWFTPTSEVKLCGHATLAASHVLLYELGNQRDTLYFATASGELIVRKGPNGSLQMTFPLDVPAPVAVTDSVKTLVARVVGKYKPTVQVAVSPSLKYMVVYDPELTGDDVSRLEPDISPEFLAAGEQEQLTAVIVTGKGTTHDFQSRVFCPWVGIPEDPVTGSAHAVLAPFWSERLNKTEFLAYQCSKRGGELEVAILSDTLVNVCGKAVTVIKGTINI